MVATATAACLICADSATITDWTPIQAWLAVEGCSCGGFFIGKTLWEERFPRMAKMKCQELAARIREWRAAGYEVWISTEDSTGSGSLIFSSVMPPPALAQNPPRLSDLKSL
jgi:hypothetical protein